MRKRRYEPLNADKLKDLQMQEYENALKVTGSVPKVADGGSLVATINVSSYGDFQCERITGKFSRLVDDGGGTANDDGSNHLTVQLRDGNSGLELFDSQIPMDLFLTPGSTRTLGVTTGAGGAALAPDAPINFPGFPFRHLFDANGTIVFDVRNLADWENTFTIVLWGTRILSPESVKGLRKLQAE